MGLASWLGWAAHARAATARAELAEGRAGKFRPEFVEKRRVGLQAFVDALVAQQGTYHFVPAFLHRFLSAAGAGAEDDE